MIHQKFRPRIQLKKYLILTSRFAKKEDMNVSELVTSVLSSTPQPY